MMRIRQTATFFLLSIMIISFSSVAVETDDENKVFRLDYDAKTKELEYVEADKIEANRVYRKKSKEHGFQDYRAYSDRSFGHPPHFFLSQSIVNLKYFGGPADKVAVLQKDGTWKIYDDKARQEYNVHEDVINGRDRTLEPKEDDVPRKATAHIHHEESTTHPQNFGD